MNRKPYIRKQSATWWVKNPFYRFYMLREATSVPVFLYGLFLLWGLYNLSQGEVAFATWMEKAGSPVSTIFHVIVLASALLHAYTWFQLTPKIMVLRFGKFRVPDLWVMIAHYLAFVIVSALIIGLSLSHLAG